MPAFAPRDPTFEKRVRGSFDRQQVMKTIGASLTRVAPGEATIELPFRADLTQQHGFIHAGVVATIADSACGYAALGLMVPDAAVLTVEYKMNLLAPARGQRIVARARVLRPGRTLTICAADVVAITGGDETAVATMLATLMVLRERPDLTPGT